MIRRVAVAATFLAGLVALATPAVPAKPKNITADMAVSLYGFTVARADLTSRLDDAAFTLAGSFSSVGLAKMLGRTDGSVAVSGEAGQPRARPDRYKLSYKTENKDHRTTIAFAGDKVSKADVSPEPPVKDKSWVKLDRGDLGAVNDPISAMIIRAGGPGEICNRTLRIFDGVMRLDVALSPAGRRDQLSGGEVTCRAGFKPVSGYRSSRSALKFLRDESKILVAFARLGATGLYVPVHATVRTQVGTVRIRAERIKLDG